MLVDPSLDHLNAHLDWCEHRLGQLVRAARTELSGLDDPLRPLLVPTEELDRILAGRGSWEAAAPPPGANAEADRIEGAADGSVSDGSEGRLRLVAMASAFELDRIDLQLLVVALSVDLRPTLARLLAFLEGDPATRRPSVRVALGVVGEALVSAAARARLMPSAPLVRHGLVEVVGSDGPLPSRVLLVPDRVVQHLLGDQTPDPLLQRCLVNAVPPVAFGHEEVVRAFSCGAGCVYLREVVAASGRGTAVAAASALDLDAVVLDLERLAEGDDLDAVLAAARREARLRGALLVVGPVDVLARRGSIAALAEASWPTAIYGRGHWDPAWSRRDPVVVPAGGIPPSAAAAMWARLLSEDMAVGTDVAAIGSVLRLSPEQIERAATAAWVRARMAERPIEEADITMAVRGQDAAPLERLAQRVRPAATPDDLILPDPVLEKLNELCDRARLAGKVFDRFGLQSGGRRQQGVTALFAGPPGTGKTLAAEIIAGALGLDLYIVDLASVVDKYIGETEKNLDRIFDAAEQVNGVLLFDEADALFGKRSEVSDARDRYANIEVSYLLQRLERFEGYAFLTTNLRSNVDEAFLRRLDALVDFPPPDVAMRHALWQLFLVERLPQAADIDLDFLSERFPLSGGHIRNAVLSAAFKAAATDRSVTMADLVVGVGREYAKLGLLCSEEEFGRYLTLVRPA